MLYAIDKFFRQLDKWVVMGSHGHKKGDRKKIEIKAQEFFKEAVRDEIMLTRPSRHDGTNM